jgi:endo-1,3(4)-beta-glucanase
MYKFNLFILLCVFFSLSHTAQTTSVGNGSYTNSYPGADSAGRNGFPSGTPQLSGVAQGKPVPTNDWWSKLVKEDHAGNLFNYPMTMKTTNKGLIVTYIPWGVIGDSAPIEVGLTGLNTNKATVSDYSDWTVTMNWKDSNHELKATSGIGMPFLYFEKDDNDVVEIKINSGNVTISGELLTVQNASDNQDFVFYAPSGSSWSASGNTYTSSLNGKNYWSMVMLPQNTSNVNGVAQELKKYAYVFPSNTSTSWNYNEESSNLTTNFEVTTDVKEGTNTNMLLGLLPHQWYNLTSNSPVPSSYSYSSVRGELKMLEGNSFTVENTFKGILPTIPYLANYSNGFDPSEMNAKIANIENDGLAEWTDSYNEGQVMNRLVQTARIADQTGNVEARDKMIATLKERLEDWLKYQSGEKAFLFYYNNTWSALLGYPSGHGQDNNINDHHFHWGYFIHAAAFMEQFEPGWSSKWGEMINLLIRDAASTDRNDTKFPFLRNFSPYAGHSWANGFASFPQGNDQESTSESMQFASSLIHWGTITENTSIRDLGIYIYTTEQTAIEEYWFDVYERNFQSNQQYSLVSRVWGNSYDNGTFWTSDIAASYGIEMYPIHGGSFYLGHDQEYSKKLWNEITSKTGVLSQEDNDNLWHDTYWKYLSFTNPQEAVNLYNAYPDRNLKFGISDAQTYHWLHSVNAMGVIDASITANYPIASVFKQNGVTTYVAHNYSDSEITVTYSDGFQLNVPANKMATNRDATVSGVISSDFNQAYANGSVNLTLTTSGTGVTKVDFYDGTTLIGSKSEAPFELKAKNLIVGVHGLYAKVYQGSNFNVSNIINVQVGEQAPFLGTPFAIPGIIEPGNYDVFEGAIGQNIAYLDSSLNNEGDYRTQEYVDAVSDNSEGKNIGWLTKGEWLEYTVEVETSGKYNLNFRYASANSNGGGPFHLEIDGSKISSNISVPSSGGWDSWARKTINNIEFTKGKHIVRLVITNGEFNLGKLNFTYNAPLGYVPPVADAGDNVVVIMPETTATLDGSLSNDPEGEAITYNWEQIYGPSVITFNDDSLESPTITNLEEGVYKLKLTVADATYTAADEVLVLVQQTSNSNPTVTLSSPTENQSFAQGTDIVISASASDLDGTISKVEFYDGDTKLGEDTTSPYKYTWTDANVGAHEIKAIVTDNNSGQGTSQTVNISVVKVTSCSEASSEASEGSFSTGYTVLYETVGNSVSVTFELLDNKSGVVAYLFKQSPFGETQMENIGGRKFKKTLGGLTTGETISYACKFAYAGGMAVTKYISYVVGNDCSGSSADEEAPENFTASIGSKTSRSIEILLNATDDSGSVVYTVSYGSSSQDIKGDSGVETSLIINNLTPETSYTFNVNAKDMLGNAASNNSIVLQATTTEDTNTSCSGSSGEAQQGAFSSGYSYNFETIGTDVKFTFELLDTDKTGVVAYLWKQTPFGEIQMDNAGGKKFTKTVGGFTNGETIRYACKFGFAGGLAVTKYFSYKVGDNCPLNIEDNILMQSVRLFPNPAKSIINIDSPLRTLEKVEIYSLLGKKLKVVHSNIEYIHVDDLSSGLYLIKVFSKEGYFVTKFMKE